MGGEAYYRAFEKLFGTGAEAKRIFKELVVLLPLQKVQQMLVPFCV